MLRDTHQSGCPNRGAETKFMWSPLNCCFCLGCATFKNHMTHEIQIAPRTYLNTKITRRINVSGTPLGYIAWSRQRVAQPRKAQKLTLATASVRQGVWWLFMLSHPEQEPEATQLQKPHVQACIHWPTQGLQWHSTALGWKHHWTRARSIWLCCVWNSWLFIGTKAWGDSQGSDLKTLKIAPTKPVGAIQKLDTGLGVEPFIHRRFRRELGLNLCSFLRWKLNKFKAP